MNGTDTMLSARELYHRQVDAAIGVFVEWYSHAADMILTEKTAGSVLRRRKEITCSFSKKNGEFGLCFLKFIEQVISLQALREVFLN